MIHYKPMIMDETMATLMARWVNDPDISNFIYPNFHEVEPEPLTPAQIMDLYKPDGHTQRIAVMDDDKVIGELSITKDFNFLMGPKEGTAWISICIGEKAYWGKGVAKQAMIYLEEECRRQGFVRIELGVFENNLRAKALYDRMGYLHFSTVKDFTYAFGQWHNDLRMSKDI